MVGQGSGEGGTGALRISTMSEVVECRVVLAWKPTLFASACCWSACPTSSCSLSPIARRGSASSRSMSSGRHWKWRDVASSRCIRGRGDRSVGVRPPDAAGVAQTAFATGTPPSDPRLPSSSLTTAPRRADPSAFQAALAKPDIGQFLTKS